jgi:hypothetical protein
MLANRLWFVKALRSATGSVLNHRLMQGAATGDSLCNGGSRLWAISLGTFFLALKRKYPVCRPGPAVLK